MLPVFYIFCVLPPVKSELLDARILSVDLQGHVPNELGS